jgi:predicted  nucleic acid-binding Zn-ribbon protein
LKCGSVFADGSPQILRGCPNCQGTRFFYTEKPLSNGERDKLREQANKDIKHLIQEMLTGDTLPADIEEGFLEKEEWVTLSVGGKAKPEKIEGSEKIHVGKDMLKSTKDLLFTEESGVEKLRIAPKAEVRKEPAKAAPKEAPKATKKKKVKKKEVAVISISEEGVYDIDVEQLLEDSPIIVQKDGSYMVHLPSAFKKLRKKESVV